MPAGDGTVAGAFGSADVGTDVAGFPLPFLPLPDVPGIMPRGSRIIRPAPIMPLAESSAIVFVVCRITQNPPPISSRAQLSFHRYRTQSSISVFAKSANVMQGPQRRRGFQQPGAQILHHSKMGCTVAQPIRQNFGAYIATPAPRRPLHRPVTLNRRKIYWVEALHPLGAVGFAGNPDVGTVTVDSGEKPDSFAGVPLSTTVAAKV
jgi:hypothetical protein